MQKVRANTAVSEILATVSLLTISVISFSLLYYIIVSTPVPISAPSVKIEGKLEGDTIIFSHLGGKSLGSEISIEIDISGDTIHIPLNDTYLIDLNGNSKWDIGEKVIYKNSSINEKLHIDAVVIDAVSNSAVFIGTLQEGTSQGKTYAYPYVNNFDVDKKRNQWNLSGDWEIVQSKGVRTSFSDGWHLDNNPADEDQYAHRENNHAATLSGYIPIPTNAVQPTLTFYYKLNLTNSSDHIYLEIQQQGQTSWTQATDFTIQHQHTTYTRHELNLDNYKGTAIRIRFRQYFAYAHGSRLFTVDDIRVGDG